MDRGDAAHLHAGTARRPARGRLRSARGVSGGLPPARTAGAKGAPRVWRTLEAVSLHRGLVSVESRRRGPEESGLAAGSIVRGGEGTMSKAKPIPDGYHTATPYL